MHFLDLSSQITFNSIFIIENIHFNVKQPSIYQGIFILQFLNILFKNFNSFFQFISDICLLKLN